MDARVVKPKKPIPPYPTTSYDQFRCTRLPGTSISTKAQKNSEKKKIAILTATTNPGYHIRRNYHDTRCHDTGSIRI
jgi:hypothetical protein